MIGPCLIPPSGEQFNIDIVVSRVNLGIPVFVLAKMKVEPAFLIRSCSDQNLQWQTLQRFSFFTGTAALMIAAQALAAALMILKNST